MKKEVRQKEIDGYFDATGIALSPQRKPENAQQAYKSISLWPLTYNPKTKEGRLMPWFSKTYPYKSVYRFTLFNEEQETKNYYWDGYLGYFVYLDHSPKLLEFYLHVMALALLEKHNDSFNQITVSSHWVHKKQDSQEKTYNLYGELIFSYQDCLGASEEGSPLVMLCEALHEPVIIDDPEEGPIVEVMGERNGGYSGIHDMTDHEYTELSKLLFGEPTNVSGQWELFLHNALGQYILIVDAHYEERGEAGFTKAYMP